jgi:hypothetical protein
MNRENFYETEIGKALFRFEAALTKAVVVDGESQNLRKIELCWSKSHDARDALIEEIIKATTRELSNGEGL